MEKEYITNSSSDRGGIQTCDPVKIVARPGYKQTKLGWIPQEWEVATFKKIAIFNPKSDTLPDTFTYIDLESVKDGVLQKRNVIQKKNSPSRAQRLLEKNDVLFQTVRPYQKNNLFFEEEGNFVASTGYAQIRAKISSRFIFHLIHATYFNNQVLARCTGTSFPAISSNDLSKVFIKLPPLPEQQKIATILSTWDAAIAKQQKLIAAKQQFKKGLMQLLLTGEKRFEGFDGEWEEIALNSLGKTFNGLTGKSKEDFGKGEPYIPYKNIFFNNRIDLTYFDYVNIKKNDNQQKVIFGDIFFTVSSETPEDIGMTSVLLNHVDDLYLNSFCFGFRLNDFKIFTPLYASFYLRSKTFRKEMYKIAQGATRYNLSKTNVLKVKIRLPEIAEQQRIASVLSAADKEIGLLQNELAKLQGQKRGLMQVLLTGEKRVKV